MIHTVHYVGENSFISAVRGGMSLARYDKNGELISDSKYSRKHLPGIERIYVPKRDGNKMMIGLSQKELNALVTEMTIYDDNNKQITEAPLNNPRAPFWKHDVCSLRLESGGTDLDDEDPIGLFWLKCFEVDWEFRVRGEDVNPAMSAIIKYEVTKAGDDIKEETKGVDEVLEATKKLYKSDFKKQVKILKGFGVNVTDPDPDTVERELMRKITELKDQTDASGERNIDTFMRLVDSAPADLSLNAIVSDARKAKVINKKSGKYYFGEIPLGRTIQDVVTFLKNDDNDDVREDILSKVKGK